MLQLVALCTKSQVSDKCELWYFTLPSYYKTLNHAKCYIHVYGWTEINAVTLPLLKHSIRRATPPFKSVRISSLHQNDLIHPSMPYTFFTGQKFPAQA